MLKNRFLIGLFCLCLISVLSSGQNLCPTGTASDKLVCVIPQAFGKDGIQVANGNHQGHFEESFISSSFAPLDSAIARQAALLPLASPSSGFTFSWDSAAKVFVSTTDSFGPVLSERAETIGKYKVFIGFDYQYFNFDTIDGISLRKLPVVLTHQDDSDPNDGITPGFRACSINAPANNTSNTNQCGFVRDVIRTDNSVDLKIHQFTTFVTFGLSNRIDVSVAIPIENIRLGISSEATIGHNDTESRHDHVFTPTPGVCPPTGSSSSVCLQKSFSNFRSASGIGDITLRVKGTAWKGERAALALGADVRLPSGDSQNFLGAGAAGVKPFVVWSYRARVSPHAFVGYETNGSSVIAGDVATGQKARLPGDLNYSAGADVWLTNRLTLAADLVGQQIFEARRTTLTSFTELGQCQDDVITGEFCDPSQGFLPAKTDTVIGQSTETYNATNLSLGLKAKPVASMLVTANVLIKVNNGGLRSKFVPLIGISYAF